MYRASSHGLKSLKQLSTAPRRAGLAWSSRPAAAFHGSTVKYYPRTPTGRPAEEDEFDESAIQELVDDNAGFDPADFFPQDSETEPEPVANSEWGLFGYVGDGSEFSQQLPPTTPLPSGLDPRQLPRKINSIDDLGPNFTEQDYASALIHGRSIHLPYIHPRTHSIPVGNITFYSHHPKLLALFTHFAAHAAYSLGIPTSKVVSLPTERRLWTVIKAPFAYKKSQENFERKTHKRMIKAWDADPEVVDRWIKYLEHHSMGGVGMRVTKWERLPIGIGKTRLAHLKDAFKVPMPEGIPEEDVKLLEVQEEADSVANRKQAIQALGTKILKEEVQKLPKASKTVVSTAATDKEPSAPKSEGKPAPEAKAQPPPQQKPSAAKPTASETTLSTSKADSSATSATPKSEKKSSPEVKAQPTTEQKPSVRAQSAASGSNTSSAPKSQTKSAPAPAPEEKAQSAAQPKPSPSASTAEKATTAPKSQTKPAPEAKVQPASSTAKAAAAGKANGKDTSKKEGDEKV